MVFLLVRWNSVPLLSRAAAALGFLERPQGLKGECDGEDNRVRAGVVSRLHRVFCGGRSLFDGFTGTGLLVLTPEVGPGVHPVLSRVCKELR